MRQSAILFFWPCYYPTLGSFNLLLIWYGTCLRSSSILPLDLLMKSSSRLSSGQPRLPVSVWKQSWMNCSQSEICRQSRRAVIRELQSIKTLPDQWVLQIWSILHSWCWFLENKPFCQLRSSRSSENKNQNETSRRTGNHDAFFSPTKNCQKSTFSPQSIFYPLFLNEDGRIRGKRFSKLHYRFRRYPTLPKTVLLESQYLQSYDDFLQILASENQEDRHNFADIEIQAKLSRS